MYFILSYDKRLLFGIPSTPVEVKTPYTLRFTNIQIKANLICKVFLNIKDHSRNGVVFMSDYVILGVVLVFTGTFSRKRTTGSFRTFATRNSCRATGVTRAGAEARSAAWRRLYNQFDKL